MIGMVEVSQVHLPFGKLPGRGQDVPGEQELQKKLLTECSWSHGALAHLTLVSTPYDQKNVFGRQDQALPSQIPGKIWPHGTQFWLLLFSVRHIFGTPCRFLW